MNEDKGQRLNKYSPLFLFINVVRKTIVPLVVGVYTYGKYANGMEKSMVIAVSLFSLLSILQYWFYHYWIRDDELEVKEGIFFKNNRKIPYTRIQNVNVLQNPLHRIFKVATLQLESASGGKPEAVMRVVDLEIVEEIKQKVKFSSEPDVSEEKTLIDEDETIEQETPYLLELDSKDVVQYGITSQKGLVLVAILAGTFYQFDAFFDKYYIYLSGFLRKPDFLNWSLWQTTGYVILTGLAVILILQALSIIWSFLKFHDFKIQKSDGRLFADMGLLSKLSATIPLKRIQLIRLKENPFHRIFKKHTVTIETAGGVNTDQQGITMRWLAPLISNQKMAGFFRNIDDKIKIDTLDWKQIPQRAWLRVFKRIIFILGLITIPLMYFKSVYVLLGFIASLPLIFLYSKAVVRNTLYYLNEDLVSFKSGVFFKSQSHVKLSKVQSVELIESPFDRRHNMVTLDIDTAGSNILLHHVKVPYLELKDAQKIRNFIIAKLEKLEFDW